MSSGADTCAGRTTQTPRKAVEVARKISPSDVSEDELAVNGRQEGRRHEPQRRPTRGPAGEVHWWERPAPDGNDRLWWAVQRLQDRRLQLRVSVTELARRYRSTGQRMTRETLSRVLSGKQPTTWATAERLAVLLDIDLDEIDLDDPDSPPSAAPGTDEEQQAPNGGANGR